MALRTQAVLWTTSQADIAHKYPLVLALAHMLDYFKATRAIGMYVCRSTPGVMDPMHVFADASFAPTGSASPGGSVCFIEGNLVTWKSRRKSLVPT